MRVWKLGRGSAPWSTRLPAILIGIALTAGKVNPKAFTYGFERLRFPNPVFIGDTITTTVTIKEMKDYKKDPDKFGMVYEACEVMNQHQKCVSYSEHVLLVEKKK